MTNTLVGDVYEKIIEAVMKASANDFEESGVSLATLNELQQEWQTKLSQRAVAQMPWDPKPAPPPPAAAPPPLASVNGLPRSPYHGQGYEANANANGSGNGNPHIKADSPADQYHPAPNGSYPPHAASQGGLARAQQLVQEQYGNAASASLNAMQQRGGLALPPGQQAKPQGLELPAGNAQNQKQSFQQQQQFAMAARQQQQLQQQQSQPRIKVESSNSPQPAPASYQQRPSSRHGQTDGADEGGLDEWRVMLAARRAIDPERRLEADRIMRERVMALSDDFQSGLMLPFEEQPRRKEKARRGPIKSVTAPPRLPTIPQLDGEADEEDDKAENKDEDDENAINSDLDDTDDEAGGPMGDDVDDLGDSILCTYDKVQRVKNKWKCTLKDGIMSVNGKEWVFHKGMGEFEW